jgi:hypothetical protein
MPRARHLAVERLLSVSKFAAQERVTPARILQLLAENCIPAARGAGHRWVIPAAATVVRLAPGRSKKLRFSDDAAALLCRMARKYVWWLRPAEALKRPWRVVAQVMELGDYDDVRRTETVLGRDTLVTALRQADPGCFSPSSWAYWHYRLELAQPGEVPPLPERVIP